MFLIIFAFLSRLLTKAMPPENDAMIALILSPLLSQSQRLFVKKS